MNVCIMDSPELKELYDSLKETGESYESIKNLVNVWQLRKFNQNKDFDFTELPTKQDIENLLKERDVPNIDSTFMQEYTQEMKDILANAPRDEQGRLLAPNDKPSNLNEWQYAQVRTKAFKEWFGDWEKLYRYNLSVSEINDLFDNKYNALSIEDFINRSLTYYENERKEIEDRSHEYPHLVERQRRDNDIYKNSILLLKDLISHIDTSNLKVQKQNFIKYQKAHNIDITKDIGGVYYSATNHIFFSNYGAPSSRTIYAAHEIIHAVTYNEYNNNEQFKKEVDSLYEYIKNISPNNKLYGLSSPTEMLAEVVNPDFQKFLLTIPSRKNNKSILQEIIDYIKDCFNIKGKRTALEDIIDLIKENARVITFNPNSVSKVVDENGEPLVVYHGSPEIFNSFDINKNTKGYYTYNKEVIPFDSERAIFFSSNPITAKSYVLSKKGIHPITIQNKLQPVDYYYRAIKELQSLRYDNYSRKSEEEIEYAILWSKKENFNKYKDSLPRYNSIKIQNGRLVLIDFSNKEHEIPSDAKDALITDLKNFLEEKIKISTQEQTDWDGNLISATNLKEGVYPVFLNIKNPLSFDYENLEYSGKYKDKYPVPFINARQVNKAIKDGNDGVIYQNIYDPYIGDNYGVFDSNQIKSATDNIGTFNAEDDRIDRFEDTILNDNNKLTEEQKQFILNALPNLDTFIEDIYAVSQEKYKKNPYYQLFVQIIDTLKVNNIPVSIVKDFDIDSIAQIRRTSFKEAIIKVNPKMLFDYLTQFDRDKMKSKTVRVILHELVHSITADVVDSHPSWSKFKGFDEAQSKFNAEIDRLYNITVREIGNEEWYGLENKAEFIAEALTDQAFQTRLSKLKYNKEQTIFERIANSIKDLFYRLFYKHGIDISNSVFEDILKVSQEYLDYAKFGINKNINTYGWGNTINKFEQIKGTTQKQILGEAVEDVIFKLKSLNHKLGSLGSDKNIEKYLKNANIPLEFRNIIIEGLNAIPSIKNLTPYTALQYLINVQNKGLIEQFNESIKKPQNEELEKLLFDYLKKYNIEINIGEAVKHFGDITGVYDIINKIIYIANNRNELTVPEEFGHAFVELMGSTVSKKEENKDFTFLMNTVENTDFYKTVYEKYKNIYLRNGEPDIYKIKKEAIGQAIGLSLITQYNNKSTKISDKDKTFFQKIREFINHILDKFKNVEYLSFNTLIDQIAKEILENNHSRLQKLDTKNYNLLDYYKTIEEQNKQDGGKALEFMQFFSQEMGNIITGSLAYRLQGATYRPKLDSLHDIDMMVPLSAHGIGLDSSAVRQAVKLAKQRNQEKLFELITNSDYFLKIKNKYPKIRFGAAYPGRGLALTVNAVYSEDTTLSERFLKMHGSYADRLSNFTEEERKQIYLFDFFLKENEIDSFLEPTYKLSLANFDIPIREKRYMGRAKDIIDYQMWKVFDEYKNKILPQEEDIMYQLNSTNIKQESKQWNRYSDNNYEVSSAGDSRFSAFNAKLKPGTKILGIEVPEEKETTIAGKPTTTNSIEYVYQTLIKKSGKGQAPSKESRLYNESLKTLEEKEDFSYREGYLPLWQEWASQNPELIEELREKSKGKVLTDQFANTRVSQARALADILNSTNVEQTPIPENLKETPETVAQDINKEEQSNYVKRIVRAEIIEQYNEELKDFGSLEKRQDRINLILRFIRNQKGSLFKKNKEYFENRLKDENLTEEERLQYEKHLKNLDADDLFISEINNIISRLKNSFSPESLSRLLSRKILEKTVPNFNELSEEEQNERIENDYNYRVQEYSKIQKHWDSLLEDVKATLRLVDGIIIDYVNPNESDTDNNNEETGSTKDNWMYQARKVDQRESLSKKVKVIISNIPILDNNGKQEYDDLGFARFMDSEEVASTLFYELSNSRSCEHFWKKFNNLPNKKPWTKIIVDTINKENNYEIKSQFYQNFRKESVPYWSQVWTKKGVIKTKKINRGKNTQLLDDWSDNIESGTTLTDNSIYGENGKPNVENASKNRDILNNLVVDFKKRGNKIGTTDNLNTLVDLIKSVGIEISTDELTRSVNGNVKKTENIFNALLTIFKGVLEGKTILATEVNNLLVYDNIVEKFNKQYNILANTIDFDLKSSELQSFRELGDTYQSVSAPSYIGTLINNLRNTEDEGEFKEFFEREFGQYSQFIDKQTNRIKNDWLNILYNNKEERANLERKVVLHANRKEFNQQTTEEYLLGMLAEFEATNNNKYAYYALPLLSDADSEEFIKFVRYVDGSVKDESGNPISYKTVINQKLAQVIFDEYERILVVKNRLKNNAETITTFDSKGTEFNYLPELNDITINIDGEIAGKGENRTVFDTITLLVSEGKDCIPVITKVVEQIMERNATEFVQDSLKMTSAETIAIKLNKDKAAVDKYLTNFFYNHTLATINMVQLLTTDLAYYKNTVDFYKRFKEVYAATLKLDTTAKFKGDDGIVEGTKTQEVLILKDNIIKAPSYDSIKSILDGRVEAGAITSEQRDELLKAYKKVNVADAQGYRTLKSYRKLMVMAGRWNKKLEKSYQRLKSGKFDYEDFSCIYNTIKPFCYSQRPVDSQVSYKNERTGETVKYGKLKVPIQIKDSEAVLLAMYSTLVSPLNKSERLVGLNKFMDDKDIDIVVFESGVKVGGQGIVDLNNVEDKDTYDKLTEKVLSNGALNPFIVHSIPTEDFGIQVETPDHLVDVEQLIGSQIKKLIQGDIDVNNTGTVTFRINEGIKEREKQMDKKQMLTHLNELLSSDIINSFEKLREEFASLDKVAETLQRELKGNSRYTKDLIVACSLVETTDQIGNVIREFGLPLNDATQFSRIENLLTSLFKNNIIKQKMRGGSPIQFSCYGVSDDLHIEMTGEGTERRIKWVDCYLPAYTKEFYKYYLTTDKDGNQFIDINKVPEELKRLIGYRVPTEARYSMLPLRIKGFLPSSEGSKIMLPAEITTIAGSDFDVDKLYILLPTFYTSYSYNYKKFADEYKHNLLLNKTEEQKYHIIISALNKYKNDIPLNELEQRIVDEFNNTKESYKEPKLKYVRYDYSKSEKENSKEARHNELISCIFSILTNEDSADKLLTPGGFDIAKKASYICTILNSGKSNIENMFNIKINSYNDAIAFYNKLMKMEIDDLKEYNIKLTSGKGVTNPITQIRIHDQNATGGSLIGVYANHNVAHSMFQNIENQVMSIEGNTKPQLYKEVVFNDKVYKSLTNVKNYEGHLITINIANFLAASVDNAKDPVLRALMQNNTTANVTCLMLRLGIEPLTIGLFLNQPIIQDMMQAVEEGKSVAESVNELVETYEQYKNVKTLRNSFKMLDEDLAFNIMYANEEKDNPAFKKYQFWVLNKFIYLYNAGQYLGRYTNINKGDTQNGAAGPSIAEVINKLTQIDNFNRSISSSIGKILEGKVPFAPIVFLPQIGDTSNFIGYATNYGILSIPSLLKGYLPYFSENISKIITSLYEIKENNESAENIEEETRLSDNIVADVFKELTLFTYSRYVRKSLNYYLNDYLNKFIDLRNKYPELSENLFFKRLKLTQPLLKDGLKLRLLQFSNAGSLSKLQKEQISLSWEMLDRSDNKEISDFVKELFDYFSYVGGFNFNAINPSYLTPISVKLENSNYINALKAINNLTKEETNRFIYQFVMHHLYNFTIDATQGLKKLTLQTLDNVDFKFNFEKAPEEFLYTSSSRKTRLPDNIKVIKGNNIIYYVNTKIESDTQHFVKVEPMGVKGKVFEYNVMSNNKTGNLKDIKQSLNFQDMETEITEDVPKEEYSIPDKSDSTELRQQYADNIAFENGASFEDFGGGIDFREQFEYLKEMNVDDSSFDELGGNTTFTHSNSFNNYEPINTPDAEGKRTC